MRRAILGSQDQIAAIRARILDYVTRTWTGLSSWHTGDIDRFVAAVTPVVAGGQYQVAALTDAFLAAVESAVLGVPARPVGVDPRVVSDRVMRGVDAAVVYARTGPTVWTALARGDPLDVALRKGLQRALVAASTDLQLARTHAARDVLGRKGNVVGYRRTLGGSDSCRLCQLASTQRYKVGDLLPIHNRCSCGVLPIFGDRDPGQVIDPDRLAALKRDGQPGVEVRDHGELGPVLGVRGQSFTGPDDF